MEVVDAPSLGQEILGNPRLCNTAIKNYMLTCLLHLRWNVYQEPYTDLGPVGGRRPRDPGRSIPGGGGPFNIPRTNNNQTMYHFFPKNIEKKFFVGLKLDAFKIYINL